MSENALRFDECCLDSVSISWMMLDFVQQLASVFEMTDIDIATAWFLVQSIVRILSPTSGFDLIRSIVAHYNGVMAKLLQHSCFNNIAY